MRVCMRNDVFFRIASRITRVHFQNRVFVEDTMRMERLPVKSFDRTFQDYKNVQTDLILDTIHVGAWIREQCKIVVIAYGSVFSFRNPIKCLRVKECIECIFTEFNPSSCTVNSCLCKIIDVFVICLTEYFEMFQVRISQ